MYSLRAVKRLQGALPRWFGLPSSGAASIEDCLGAAGSTLVDPPWVPYMLKSRTRTLTSAAQRENRVEERITEVVDEINNGHVELETAETRATTEIILNMPDNIDTIGGLNPELREAMEAHASFSRSKKDVSPRQHFESLLSDANNGKATKLARATQLRARAGLTHADVGISEKQFQNEQRAAVTKASDYNRAFASPHDVARMLVEARADDICIIDVRGHCAFTDYMVVATGRSSQLVHLLAQAVLHELKQRCKEVAPGVAPGIEGADEVDAQWLVVDSGSVVVHIFAEGARKEYNLEALWGGKNNVTRVATPQRNIQTLHTIKA
ncbi:hypothetical protein Ndes2437A_g01519 [Nannochloris sp. 'desiccata']